MPAAFLAPAPFLTLLERFDTEIEVLQSLAPQSDVTGAMIRAREGVARAFDEARKVEHWISVAEAQRLTGRPPSTIKRLCRETPEKIGAKKIGKAWAIHLPTLAAFLNHHSQEAP